jgi:hypothetical protein
MAERFLGLEVESQYGWGVVSKVHADESLEVQFLDWTLAGGSASVLFTTVSSISRSSFAPLGACLLTRYGTGVLLEHRRPSGVHIVRLWSSSGASGSGLAMIQKHDILRVVPACIGFPVQTPYGSGVVNRFRSEDGIFSVDLVWGEVRVHESDPGLHCPYATCLPAAQYLVGEILKPKFFLQWQKTVGLGSDTVSKLWKQHCEEGSESRSALENFLDGISATLTKNVTESREEDFKARLVELRNTPRKLTALLEEARTKALSVMARMDQGQGQGEQAAAAAATATATATATGDGDGGGTGATEGAAAVQKVTALASDLMKMVSDVKDEAQVVAAEAKLSAGLDELAAELGALVGPAGEALALTTTKSNAKGGAGTICTGPGSGEGEGEGSSWEPQEGKDSLVTAGGTGLGLQELRGLQVRLRGAGRSMRSSCVAVYQRLAASSSATTLTSGAGGLAARISRILVEKREPAGVGPGPGPAGDASGSSSRYGGAEKGGNAAADSSVTTPSPSLLTVLSGTKGVEKGTELLQGASRRLSVHLRSVDLQTDTMVALETRLEGVLNSWISENAPDEEQGGGGGLSGAGSSEPVGRRLAQMANLSAILSMLGGSAVADEVRGMAATGDTGGGNSVLNQMAVGASAAIRDPRAWRHVAEKYLARSLATMTSRMPGGSSSSSSSGGRKIAAVSSGHSQRLLGYQIRRRFESSQLFNLSADVLNFTSTISGTGGAQAVKAEVLLPPHPSFCFPLPSWSTLVLTTHTLIINLLALFWSLYLQSAFTSHTCVCILYIYIYTYIHILCHPSRRRSSVSTLY